MPVQNVLSDAPQGNCHAECTKCQIETAGLSGEVGGDDRHGHSEYRGAERIQQAAEYQRKHIGQRCIQQRLERDQPPPYQQQRSSAREFGTPADPRRNRGHDCLRHQDDCRDNERGE